MDDAGEIHAELRPLLFSIAYRMLGSVAEAEDVVQEAYLRWHRALTAGTEVQSPKAYLAAVTTRLAIDQLRARKSRREAYLGPWLPEPLVAETEADVAQHAEMAESLSMAFLVLLESLSPVERAVFLLREVFEYGYDEIAQIVDKSEANCRQIFARARRHIEASRPRFEPSAGERNELARRFFAACEQGDMDGLLRRPSPNRCPGGSASPGSCSGCSPAARSSARRSGRSRSTGSRAGSASTPRGRWSTSSPSTSPTATSSRSGRWSTPTSSSTSGRSRTSPASPAPGGADAASWFVRHLGEGATGR